MVNARGYIFPVSFEDTASDVFATAIGALLLGFGRLRGDSGRRVAPTVLVCGLAALLVDIYLYRDLDTADAVNDNPAVLFPAPAVLGISALLFASGGATVDPPVHGGPWRQVGAAVTSRPGKLAHFFRSATSPTALAVVARSNSSKPIRMTWFSYCEFESDDAKTEENQASVTGIRRVTAFPHVLDGATLCNVSVTIRVANGRATAAIFSG